jgi:hypothetical protein
MPVVYIPTLGRVDMVEKTVPHWLEQELFVRLVVERHEYHPYNNLKKRMGWGKDVYVLPLPLSMRGTGYARRFIVQHARRTNQTSIIMSDDDIRPDPNSDFWELIDEAEQPGVLGIGATRSLHDRNTGGAISRNAGPILCPGGWGFTVYGLNINTALQVGNYDPLLHSFGEDAELMRQGVSRKIPWRVHCDVKFISLNKRFDPGGFSSKYILPEARIAAEQTCQSIIRSRWPDYASKAGSPWRFAWQRFYDDYMPGWREASAIHGGDLKKLKVQ